MHMYLHTQKNTCAFTRTHTYTFTFTVTHAHAYTYIDNIHARDQTPRKFLHGARFSIWIKTPNSYFNHLTTSPPSSE